VVATLPKLLKDSDDRNRTSPFRELLKDANDRNRTSPLAFTGNRFEFRAVGGSQPIADSIVVLNTIVAESLEYVEAELRSALPLHRGNLKEAIASVLEDLAAKHRAIVYNGDCYSDAWQEQAETFGLPHLKNTPEALRVLHEERVWKLFDHYGVLTRSELDIRYQAYLEQYITTIHIEAKLLVKLAKTTVLPAALRYQTDVATSVERVRAAGANAGELEILSKLAKLILKLERSVRDLEQLIKSRAADLEQQNAKLGAGGLRRLLETAHFCADKVLLEMNTVRDISDALEDIVADVLWPLPTYQELLFLR